MPTVISTFAGCGGSSLGYELAGFNELLAIDHDKNSMRTFRANFDSPYWLRDIRKVDVKSILEFCDLKPGELDVLDGSPPCQGFSTAGKRKVNDRRNDLFKDFIRLIDGLKPKVFIMENVTGMVKGKMKGRFKEIILSLKDLNYNVKAKMLNSANYNVPQSRQRVFFMGVRNDLNRDPQFPVPSKDKISSREAIDDIKSSAIELKSAVITNKNILKAYYRIGCGKTGEQIYEGKYFNTVKLHPNRPAPTITKTRGLLHYSDERYLTIPELKRLASFPDDFILTGTVLNQWARIGNAVMPNQMRAIAEVIKKLLFFAPKEEDLK